MNRPNLAGLSALLAPSSIAVIGASDDPTRIGGRPVSYLLRAGFPDAIFPVNPNRESVQGLRAYASVSDVPEPPDVCILAVSAALVPEILEDCARRGAKAAVVFSSGFAEAGKDGRIAQGRLSDTANRTGMRILGPNCLGLFNARRRWMGTFASPIRHRLPEPGPISIASQSGAVGSELFSLLRNRGLDTGTWITTGNEADVDLADAIAYLVSDPDTEVIVAYAEGVGRGRALCVALESASAAGKPVIFLKTGRSPAGANAVGSHTAANAGFDPTYSGVFRQFGVLRVRSFEELVDAAYVTTFGVRPSGRRLAIVTISGGAGILMADAATDRGLEVPEASPGAQAEMASLLPFASVRNPVDTTAQVFNDLSLISRFLRILLSDGDFDAAALFLTALVATEETSRRLIAELDEAMSGFEGVPLIVSLLAPSEINRLYENAGYPVFTDPTRAVAAAAVLARLTESVERDSAPSALEIPPGARRLSAGGSEELAGAERTLGARDSLQLLKTWGVPCIDPSSDPAGREASGAPRKPGPPAEHAEVAVRIRRDESFGPVVVLDLGGTSEQAPRDVAVRIPPFGPKEGRRMIHELSGSPNLHGVGGGADHDVEALADLLSRVSMFAAAEEKVCSALDLDPVRIFPVGQGALVLEAGITVTTDGPGSE